MKYKLTRDKVQPNPTIEQADALLEEARQFGATEIESIGGGSVIDVGKYIAWNLKISHHVIPTTAGTGSEVTKFAVFMVNGKKKTIEDEGMIPTSYELKPELVTSCPEEVTIASGLDALAHAIESYWSPYATPDSKVYANRAITGVTSSLYDSYKNPENEFLRGQMLEAANNAGRAINITKTSICHALSYPLTRKGMPHGMAVASVLPIFMEHFNFDSAITKQVARLVESFGIKKPEFTEEDIEEAMQSERFYNTPKPVTKEILCKLISLT